MALFGRKKRPGTLRESSNADTAHLEAFAASRQGVEAFVEPRTAVTEATVVFVAADGEWTRRRIDGPDGAQKLARKLAIPVYDAAVMGYPERMREWSARQKDNRSGQS
ncbi:MAG: oxidoreductase [Geodermatophilaceae bacterium]|nr:oxidoreductase [Geodermatophilaceae bacterium]